MAQAQVLPQLYELDLLQQNFTIRTEDWRLLHIRPRANRVKAFDLADVKIDRDGYRVATIYVDNTRHWLRAARVIWVLVNGYDPGDALIDHWDRNRLNNDPANLRLATDYESILNRSITTSAIGVHIARNGRFEARSIDTAGKYVHLGTFDTPEEASAAYATYAISRFSKAASRPRESVELKRIGLFF